MSLTRSREIPVASLRHPVKDPRVSKIPLLMGLTQFLTHGEYAVLLSEALHHFSGHVCADVLICTFLVARELVVFQVLSAK